MRYGQDYYTLRSIGITGVPPPRIHMHLKLYNVRRDIPIGTVQTDSLGKELDVPEADTAKFETWMRGRFSEKDREFERYYSTGSLAGLSSHVIPGPATSSQGRKAKARTSREVSIPLETRGFWEVLEAFAIPGPTAWGLLTGRLR